MNSEAVSSQSGGIAPEEWEFENYDYLLKGEGPEDEEEEEGLEEDEDFADDDLEDDDDEDEDDLEFLEDEDEGAGFDFETGKPICPICRHPKGGDCQCDEIDRD